jgi:hypothetical protein
MPEQRSKAEQPAPPPDNGDCCPRCGTIMRQTGPLHDLSSLR